MEHVDKVGEVDIDYDVCQQSCSTANAYYSTVNIQGQEVKKCQSKCASEKWNSELKCVDSCKELGLCGIQNTSGQLCDQCGACKSYIDEDMDNLCVADCSNYGNSYELRDGMKVCKRYEAPYKIISGNDGQN